MGTAGGLRQRRAGPRPRRPRRNTGPHRIGRKYQAGRRGHRARIRVDALAREEPGRVQRARRRQCTSEYKIRPLKAAARTALGYPSPRRIPRGVFAEQAIGISVDEIGRAKDADVSYLKNVFPLLDLGWTRADCESYLTARNWVGAVKSACLGCPFHSNSQWREIRDNDPPGWADVVAFDRQIRHGHPRSPATGRRYFLHPSCRPLEEVDLDRPARRRPATTAASAVGAGTAETEIDGDPDGCSPWACRSGPEVPAEPTAPAAPAIGLENVA